MILTTDPSTPPAGPVIGAGFVGYTAGEITKTGTATWNPTINVAITPDMAAGVYSATITHSVS